MSKPDFGEPWTKILGIFSSREKAWDHYYSTHTENDRYWNTPFVEYWVDNKKESFATA